MRTLRAAAILLVVLLLAAYAFAKLTSGNGPVASTPGFGHGLGNIAVSTSTKIRLSPDSTRVAIVEDGAVTVVRTRDGARVMSAGTNVVDAAWMPDGDRVLIVEGPASTGQVDAVDMQGKVAGVARLQPAVAFGDGYGLAVNSDGTQAAAIAVTRDAIGGAVHTDLAVVDLQSGTTRVVPTSTDERMPVFVDDNRVATLASGVGASENLVTRDLTNSGDVLLARSVTSGPYAVAADGRVVFTGAHRRLMTVDPDTRTTRTLRRLPAGHTPVDVDTHLTRALVRSADADGTVHLSFDDLT